MRARRDGRTQPRPAEPCHAAVPDPRSFPRREIRCGPPRPTAGGDRPGRIRSTATGYRASHALAARRVACSIKAGDTGRAIIPRQFDPANAAYRALAAQCHRKPLGKWIDPGTIVRQETVRLSLSEPQPQLGDAPVELRPHRPFEQRPGNDDVAVLAGGVEPGAVLTEKARPPKRHTLVE